MSAVEILHPKDEAEWLDLRLRDVTSTESSALFGINPYFGKFELHHRKAKKLPMDFEPNERTIWGQALEPAIAAEIARQQGFEIRRAKEYLRDPELRMGGSFDYEVVGQNAGLEIKNVDSLQFRDGWLVGDDGEVEASAQIEVQIQHQMALKGWDFTFIGALVGGNRLVLLRRLRNEKVIGALKNQVKAFWDDVDAGKPPPPEFPQDASFICSLYQSAAQGKCVDMSQDNELLQWALQYKEFGKDKKACEDMQKELKARILQRIGDAEKVLLPNGSISAAMTNRKGYTVEPTTFRGWSVNFKKGKE